MATATATATAVDRETWLWKRPRPVAKRRRAAETEAAPLDPLMPVKVAESVEAPVADAVYAVLTAWRKGWTLGALTKLIEESSPLAIADALDPGRDGMGLVAATSEVRKSNGWTFTPGPVPPKPTGPLNPEDVLTHYYTSIYSEVYGQQATNQIKGRLGNMRRRITGDLKDAIVEGLTMDEVKAAYLQHGGLTYPMRQWFVDNVLTPSSLPKESLRDALEYLFGGKTATEVADAILAASLDPATGYAVSGLVGEAFDYGMDAAFNVINDKALLWARQHVGNLITGINDTTRDGIRSIIQHSLAGGRYGGGRWPDTPDAAARYIKDLIGLTDRQAAAVANYREQLTLAAQGLPNSAGRYPPVRGGPKVQPGMTQGQIDQLVAAYGERQLRYRASLIARTETMAAANAGLWQSYEDAYNAGWLGEEAWVEWYVHPDERLCGLCRSMAVSDVGSHGGPHGIVFAGNGKQPAGIRTVAPVDAHGNSLPPGSPGGVRGHQFVGWEQAPASAQASAPAFGTPAVNGTVLDTAAGKVRLRTFDYPPAHPACRCTTVLHTSIYDGQGNYVRSANDQTVITPKRPKKPKKPRAGATPEQDLWRNSPLQPANRNPRDDEWRAEMNQHANQMMDLNPNVTPYGNELSEAKAKIMREMAGEMQWDEADVEAVAEALTEIGDMSGNLRNLTERGYFGRAVEPQNRMMFSGFTSNGHPKLTGMYDFADYANQHLDPNHPRFLVWLDNNEPLDLESILGRPVSGPPMTVTDQIDLWDKLTESDRAFGEALRSRMPDGSEVWDRQDHMASFIPRLSPQGQVASREMLVSTLVHEWAVSSGDHHKMPLLLQRLAAEKFDLVGDEWDLTVAFGATSARAGIDAFVATPMGQRAVPALRHFLDGMYARTQADLARRGYGPDDLIPLGRGAASSVMPVKGPGEAWVQNPLMSFSTSFGLANGWSQNSTWQLVPRSRVFSTCRTGFGCLNEYEAVVIGQPGEVGWII